LYGGVNVNALANVKENEKKKENDEKECSLPLTGEMAKYE
jgi:hypothetical protein